MSTYDMSTYATSTFEYLIGARSFNETLAESGRLEELT